MARLAVAAVAEASQLRRAGPFEISRSNVVEDQVRLQAEQIAQLQVNGLFDALFLRRQIVQAPIPQLQLIEAHLDPSGEFPHRHPAAASRRAYMEILQPLRQRVLAARATEPVGKQGKDPLRQRLTVAPRSMTGIQDGPQREFLEQMAGDQDRSPRAGARSGNVIDGHPARIPVGLGQHSDQGIQMRSQQVLAPQMSYDPLLDLVLFAEGLHQAEILLLAIA